MFRRIIIAGAVLFLAVSGSVATTGSSQAVKYIGGHYGSANSCYNVINDSADLKAHRSFCYNNEPGHFWEIFQWLTTDPAIYIGGAYGRLDGCYDGINGDIPLKHSRAFCNVGSDGVYHIYIYFES